MNDSTSKRYPRRGFASMDPQRVREIASQGGQSAHKHGPCTQVDERGSQQGRPPRRARAQGQARREEGGTAMTANTDGVPAPHDPLRQAAEQFVASCKDGNVADLIDYYEEIFTEALGVAPPHPPLAQGFDGSAVRPGPNHSTIEIWYDTEDQARAAHKVIRDLIDASGVKTPLEGQR
jgi:general stress protein YciG